ncbi:ABC transporter ATP-binding protein [Desulfurispora thermophila]|uniref:ABC transporter ATP-binding protein n=1 Tax=Desulfurispora thermophila TaxID=265470 RepID=UPI00037195CB|nr:ABC transporter ATP-binding protein [Desulfurispora thermophila]
MVIETYNLTKQYNGKGGCQDVCLSVPEGQIFGFLGPNGAGKSTFVKVLVGLLFPTAGKAWLLGRPLGDREARRQMGFLPENFRYHPWMTGQDLLRFHAALYGMPPDKVRRRIGEVLELVGLRGFEKQRVGTYSKGMQQRIGLAAALLPDPRLLFLDEPTSALDPLGRREVREIIRELARQGKTIFLNSHLLSEVEALCRQVAIINRGRIVAAGRVDELLKGRVEVVLQVGNPHRALLEALESYGENMTVQGNRIALSLKSREQIPALSELVVKQHGLLYELTVKNSLEEIFVQLVREGES